MPSPSNNAGAADELPRELSPKARRTREGLIDSARSIFERDGFVDARISDIAAGAGVAHGTFYTYFASKEAVFREIVLEIQRDMTTHPMPPPPPDDDPRLRIEHANRVYITAWRRNARIMATLEQVVTMDAEVRELRKEIRRPFLERNVRAIKRWQAAGIADRALDPVYAANALGAMVDKFMHTWMVLEGEDYFEEEKAISTLTRLWVQSLGIPASEAPPHARRARKTRTA